MGRQAVVHVSAVVHNKILFKNPLCPNTSTTRDANSPAIFIPRGFGESGNGNLSFLGDWGNKNLFPGFQVGVWGDFGEYFVSDLKLI